MENLNRTEYLGKCGIYLISDKARKRNYIGSTNNLYKRINSHIRGLCTNSHANNFLQNHYNKYGLDSLEVTILEIYEEKVSHKILLEREQYYLDIYYGKTCFNAFKNVTFLVDNPEIRRKCKIAVSKNWEDNYEELSKIVSKNLIAARASQKLKKERGEVRVAPNKGRKTSKEVRIKQSISAIKRGRQESTTVSIYKYNLNGNYIDEYSCIRDAARECNNNFKSASNIRDCAAGGRDKAYGFVWRYTKENTLILNFSLIDIVENTVTQYLSLRDIAKVIECNNSTVSRAVSYNKIIFNRFKITKNE